MISVFYDGMCGLCSREIAVYRRMDRKGRFDWVDISRHPERLEAVGVSYDTAMREFHVCDGEGRVHTGVDAFVILWRGIGLLKPLAFLVRLPVIYPLVKGAYQQFAQWRLKRPQQCRIAP